MPLCNVTKEQNKLLENIPPDPGGPVCYPGNTCSIYEKSCGSQLFWDVLDVVCAENYFDD